MGAEIDDGRRGLDHLGTEASVAAAPALEDLPVRELVRGMNVHDARAARVVHDASADVTAAIERIVARMHDGGRLVYAGAGTSGRLGVLDASEIPPTFGVAPSRVVGLIAGGVTALTTSVEAAEDDPSSGEADVAALALTSADVVVGIASSGRTPYVLGAVAAARRAGALTVGISCNAGTPLSAAVDCAIELPVGPEFVAGSTRLVAGTVTKMVLNMISTIAMVKSGHTYGPYMIDVHATNEKLRRRATRMVATITGAGDAESLAALVEAGWSPRLAVVMLRHGVTPDGARRLLDEAHGSLRTVLEEQ